jgi:phenylacetate-CoA ligase
MSDVLTPCDAVPSIAPYTAVSSVIGRTEIQPYFINEAGELDFISPITISEIYIAGLTHFQLRILSDSFFEFVAVLDPSMNIRKRKSSYSGLCRRLREILASKRMNNVQFEVKLEKLIPVNKRTGKVPLVIDTRSS